MSAIPSVHGALLVAIALASAVAADDQPVQPVYPAAPIAVDPLAQRLCRTLHTLSQARKAECCGTKPGSTLVGECERTLSYAVRDRAAALDGAEIDRCETAASQARAGCDWVRNLAPPPAEACRGVVHGQLASGARCRSSLECRDGLYCRGLGPTTAGLCAAPAPTGGSCAAPLDALATYAGQVDYEQRHPACQGFCQKGRCLPFVAAGGACASGLQCVAGTHCASGRCTPGPLPRIGERCAGTSCAGDAGCVAGLCVALKAAGEPCTSPFECKGTCLTPAGSATGQCGMQCSTWPPAGYAPPVYASPKPKKP